MHIDGVWIPILAIASVPMMAIGIPLAKAWARRIDARPLTPAIPSDVVARLERMEQAIDAIAVEVERISEGQRFTTKLLADRSDLKAGIPAPLSSTSRGGHEG